jgi:hypothetical protein
MAIMRVETYDAIREGDAVEFQRQTTQWKRHAEKMPTSVLLRGGNVTDAGRECLEELLYGLDVLEEQFMNGRVSEVKMTRAYVERLYRTCCDEFRGGVAGSSDNNVSQK